MRLDELPMIEIRAGVGRLRGCFGATKDADPATFATELQRALLGWSVAEFHSAIGDAIAEERYFPRVAAIRKYRPGRVPGPRAEPGPDICPRCRQHWYFAGFEMPSGDVLPRLRCGCAQGSTRWDTPAAVAWVETDADLVRDGYGAPLGQEWAA